MSIAQWHGALTALGIAWLLLCFLAPLALFQSGKYGPEETHGTPDCFRRSLYCDLPSAHDLDEGTKL